MRDTHMKQLMKKACALLAGIVLLAGSGSIQPLHADEEKTVRILFTNDINDHIVSSDAEFTVTDAEGNTKEIATISHPGKAVQIPYIVTKGSVITLYAMDSTVTQQTVN